MGISVVMKVTAINHCERFELYMYVLTCMCIHYDMLKYRRSSLVKSLLISGEVGGSKSKWGWRDLNVKIQIDRLLIKFFDLDQSL